MSGPQLISFTLNKVLLQIIRPLRWADDNICSTRVALFLKVEAFESPELLTTCVSPAVKPRLKKIWLLHFQNQTNFHMFQCSAEDGVNHCLWSIPHSFFVHRALQTAVERQSSPMASHTSKSNMVYVFLTRHTLSWKHWRFTMVQHRTSQKQVLFFFKYNFIMQKHPCRRLRSLRTTCFAICKLLSPFSLSDGSSSTQKCSLEL